MSPAGGESNKKRKLNHHHSDTNSVLSNLPDLPPPRSSSPLSHSHSYSQSHSHSNSHSNSHHSHHHNYNNTTHHTTMASQSTSNPSATAGIPTNSSVLAAAACIQQQPSIHTAPASTTNATGSSKRPKRSRSKVDKKEDTQCPSRFHCNYCGRDLSSAVRARCSICPDYDSCLDCFSVGAALLPHKADHDYRLIQVIHTPLYEPEWSADEEEKLLEGLETYGIGNWEQVANLIGTKEAIETEAHYLKVYLHSATAPLPNPSFLYTKDENNKIVVGKGYDADDKSLRVMHKHQQEDAAGWMPKRQDFVYEWDNEAEEIIGDMEVTEDDSDRELKLKVLEIYCRKLNEREIRKNFVHERDLTDVKAHETADKKRSKEEKEIREKMKVFMRVMPQDYMDKFVKGLVDEKEIRKRIEVIREGRLLGARTIEECQRLHAKAVKKELRMANSAANASTSNAKGCASGNAGDNGSCGPGGSNHDGKGGSGVGGGGGGETSIVSGMSQRRGRRSNGENISEAAIVAHSGGGGHHGSQSSGVMDSKERKGMLSDGTELEMMTGSELLSSKEIALCGMLDIAPHQYLIVKEVMIRESALKGQLRKKDAKALIKLDHTKLYKIHDYLADCGWVRTGTSGGGSHRARAGAGGGTNNIGSGGIGRNVGNGLSNGSKSKI